MVKLLGREIVDGRENIYLFGIKISRRLPMKKSGFKTFQALSQVIRKNIGLLPENIDLIVGIPRSGIIPAYIIGLFLNKPVCTLGEFLNNIQPQNGMRKINTSSEFRNILLVDDSVSSGNSINSTKELLKQKQDIAKYNIMFAAIFATKNSVHLVDYYFEIIELPRLFQWNYLNHSIASQCCFDMDGVLCADPTTEENDDGEKYINFILNAKPLFIPQYEIHSIVTSRLEKYRPQTKEWLKMHNVKYKNLYMLNLKSAKERQAKNCHASFKAKVYKNLPETICFIESEPNQARQIAELSGKPCICSATDEFFEGN